MILVMKVFTWNSLRICDLPAKVDSEAVGFAFVYDSVEAAKVEHGDDVPYIEVEKGAMP